MRKLYNLLLLLLCIVSSALITQAQTVSIGTGTSATLSTSQTATSLQSPYNSYYGYSYVQTIYLQSEIKATGNITSINYYFTGSTLASSDELKIYMGTVTRSAFTSTTDWEPLSNLTLVFDGTISGTTPGWVTITLSTPFAYNNTGNLLIAVDENKAGDNGTEGYRATNLGANRVIFFRDDDAPDNPDPATPPTANGRSSFVGNIQIDGLTLTGCQSATGLGVSGVTASAAVANWTAPAGGSAVVQYNWELRTSGAAGSGATGLTASGNATSVSTSVNLSSLTANTAYNFYLRTECTASEFGDWSAAVPFTTLCAPVTTLPFFENFNNAGLPACWSTAVTSGTTNWTVGTTTSPGGWGDIPAAHSGTRFTAKAYTTSTANLVSPPMDLASLGSNQARFSLYIYRISATTPDDIINVYVNTAPNTTGATNLLTIKTLTTEAPTVPSNGWYKYGADIPASFNTSGTIYFIIEGVSAPANEGYDLGVEDFLVELIPSCEGATGIVVNNISTTGADLSWVAPATGGTPQDYQIYLSTSSTAPTGGSTPTDTLTTSPSSLTGLTAATPYYLWIRTHCGSGDVSTWSSVVTFTTACNPVNVPYTQDFESATTPNMPACTMRENAGTGNNWITSNAPGSGFTSKTLQYIYNEDFDANAWFYTQGLNLTAGTSYRVSYRYGNNSATFSEKLEVKYGNAAANAAMTELIATHNPVIGGTPSSVSYDITPSTTGVYYIGFHVFSDANEWNLYVDDISVILTPTCEMPSGVMVNNITTTDADISWTDPTTGGTPQDFQIYLSTSSTAPTAASVPTDTLTTNPSTVTGLTPATTYYLWIRTNCGSGDVSAWTAVTTFTTLCVSVTSFTENFDAITAPALPMCWKKLGASGLANTQTTTPNTAPNTMYIYSSSTSDIAVVSVPPVSNLDAGTHRLRLQARANFTVGGVIEVGYLTDPSTASTFTLIQSFTAASLTYQEYTITPTGVPAGNFVMAFRHTGSPANSVLIDDVRWELIPTCEAPTAVTASAITTTSADISWTAPTSGGGPLDYQIYYSTSNTAPTAGSTPNVTGASSPATLSAPANTLTANTTYYVWVRSNCGSGDLSAWSAMGTFKTLCNAFSSLPWTEGFEGVASPGTDVFPDCWKKVTVAGTNAAGTTATNDTYRGPRTGTQYMFTQWNSTHWVFTPGFQLTAGTSYDFSFYMMNKEGTTGFTMDVAYGEEPTETGMVNALQTPSYAANNTSYTKFKYTITPSTTGTYYFGVKSTSPNADPWYLSFDDFRLEVTPTCEEPVSLAVTGITQTNAQVDWQAPSSGTVTDYSWELRTSGAAGSGAAGLVTSGSTATTTVNFTTLTATTAYTFYVRTNCVSPDVSSWASVTFNTLISNDECADAITLTNGVTVNATTVGGTESMPAEACGTWTGDADDDVWFKFTANFNGNATVTVTQTSTFDASVQAYSGTCGSLVNIGCSDEFTPDDEVISLTGLIAGNTYYVRVYTYGGDPEDMGAFTIMVTGTALPVSLVEFRGEAAGSMNKLSWTTATETNNKGFELQRSADGKNFSSLAFIASKGGNGNSTATLNYNYNDEKPLGGTNYYRLKQIDKDGKFTHSNIVVLKSKVTGIALSSVYPNPATSEVRMVVTSPVAEKVTIVITDLTGKVLMQQRMQLVMGDNQSQFNVQSLAAGTYLIKAICANGCETAVHKFVKQ